MILCWCSGARGWPKSNIHSTAPCRWYVSTFDVLMIKQGCQVGAIFKNDILYLELGDAKAVLKFIVTNKETAQIETIHKTQFASS